MDPFESLHNTRDLAGMKTADGYTIRTGLLFRSGHLSDLSEKDISILSDTIHTIIDFRSDQERTDQPDKPVPGVQSIHIPIVDSLTAGISREEEADRSIFQSLALKPAEAKAYMCGMYRAFVSDYAVRQYSRFIKTILENDGPVLWHCTAGKDRAGIASVIVEEILGVGKEDIVSDYLKTNEYLEQDIVFLTDFVKKQIGTDSGLADESLRYLFGAEKDYLLTFFDAVDQEYGSIEVFVEDGLGVDEEMRNLLREKYLE